MSFTLYFRNIFAVLRNPKISFAAFLTATITVTAGCASQPYLHEYQGENKGYVLISQAAKADTSYGAYSLRVRKLGTPDSWGQFIYFQNNMFYGDTRDFDDTNSNGIVRLLPFEPGNYEIYSYSVGAMGGSKSWTTDGFSIPFSVKQGEVTYLGEFLSSKETAENIFGVTLNWGANLTISNKIDRDKAIINSRSPVNLEQVNIQVPQTTQE